MSSEVKKEKSKVFETILSSPGMQEKCKVNLTLSRQNIIFLGRLIEAGLTAEKNYPEDEIIAALPNSSRDELKLIQEEILSKGNLAEFYQRLKSL